MADITVTAASVVSGSNAVIIRTKLFGEACTAGQLVYLNSSDDKLYKAKDDTAVHAAVVGILLNGGGAGQPGAYQLAGYVNPGGTVVVGMVYGVSDNAGGIAPYTDLGSGDFVSVFGVGYSATLILIGIQVSGVAKP
jgi:hypothetical protein